jgi:Xaa-Pro aminopeptidase
MAGQTRRDFLKVAALGATVITAASVASPIASSAQEKVRVPILPPEDPQSVLMARVSTAELERRWKAVRDMMRNDRLDYLVIRNDEAYLGGGVKWFTDFQATTQYAITVIFPVDDGMTFISHGANAPAPAGPPDWAIRGIKTRFSANYFASAGYTNTYDAELIVKALKAKKKAVIGIVGRAFMPITIYEYMVKNLPEAKFVDATDQIDHLMAIKSAEEIEIIKSVAALQDAAMEHVKKILQPGKRCFEIAAEAQYACLMQGATRFVLLCNSGPKGKAVPFQPPAFQNKVINDGDQVTILIETNGPSGLWTELGRVLSLGKPSQQLADAFASAVEAQNITLNLLKPGAGTKEAWDANNAFLVKKGFEPELRLYAHGMGYHFVERPLIRYDETMKIKPGMNIVVHPTAANRNVWAGLTDNYIITESGPGLCIHKTPKEVIIV